MNSGWLLNRNDLRLNRSQVKAKIGRIASGCVRGNYGDEVKTVEMNNCDSKIWKPLSLVTAAL